jgi:transcription initiation factor TFIIH subunit 2
MRDGIAERWSSWLSNSVDFCLSLEKVSRIPLGDPSLQNAIDLGRNSLLHVPKHISKEILIVYGSLYTCDPGDILDSISLLVKDGVRTSIVGLSGSVRICETIASSTKGKQHFFDD